MPSASTGRVSVMRLVAQGLLLGVEIQTEEIGLGTRR